VEPGGRSLETMPELRRRLFNLALASPGLGISDLARLASCLWTSAFLQIEHLCRGGLVRTVKLGRRRVVFPDQDENFWSAWRETGRGESFRPARAGTRNPFYSRSVGL
jgi:hypothetical protein